MWPFTKRSEERRARDKPERKAGRGKDREIIQDSRRVIGGYREPRNLRYVNRPRADRTVEGNEAIYAAVSRISNTVASMSMHLYKGWEIQKNHPLERLVALEPHPGYSAFGWRQTMEVMRNTEGNAYALQVLDELGTIRRLDILNPTRVTVMRDPETAETWYRVTMDDGEQMLLPGYMILNIKHLSANGEKGIRPIDVLRRSLDYDEQVKELALDQLDGVNSGIMLTVPNTGLDQDQKDELVDRFLETYEKSGRTVVVLEGGLTATHFQGQTVNSDVLDVERITRNRVATVYNLPAFFLGDYSGVSYSSTEQLMLTFLQMTILPIVRQW